MDGENGLKKIAEMLEAAGARGASDIHLAAGYPIMFRIDGELVPMSGGITEPDEMEMLVGLLADDVRREELARNGETLFSCTVPESRRIRVSIFRERSSYAMALRLLQTEIPAPESLGLPEAAKQFTEARRGLVLVCGAAGSGKSATLAALIGAVAKSQAKTVITIERPVEYRYPQGKAMVLQREIGRDSKSYADALRAALRQDADVILVGELEDEETISLAVAAAESGRLVFSSLPCESAAAAVEYITSSFAPERQAQMRARFAGVFAGVVAQQLLPVQDAGGRVAAFELLSASPSVRSLIREGRISQFSPGSPGAGVQKMDDAIYELYMRSRISSETAVSYAQDSDEMRRKVQIF